MLKHQPHSTLPDLSRIPLALGCHRPILSSNQASKIPGAIHAVTAESFAAHKGCSVASARGRLLAAERLGHISRWRPLVGEPALYTATRAGLRAATVYGISPQRVSPACARHALACSRAAMALGRAYPSLRVIGEPELRAREREHDKPLYSVRVGGGRCGEAALHRPDLVLVSDSPDRHLPIPVEVELTVKAPRRLIAICRAWARCRHVSGVLYVTTGEVQAPLQRAIENAQAREQIVQVTLDALQGGEDAPREMPRAR